MIIPVRFINCITFWRFPEYILTYNIFYINPCQYCFVKYQNNFYWKWWNSQQNIAGIWHILFKKHVKVIQGKLISGLPISKPVQISTHIFSGFVISAQLYMFSGYFMLTFYGNITTNLPLLTHLFVFICHGMFLAGPRSGAHFMNDFSIVIQIWWKNYFCVTLLQGIICL